MVSPKERLHSPKLEWIALWSTCAAYIVWLLSLPVFPSQDGPMHLYYASVLGKLLLHHADQLAHFYQIKHLLPPYALYYYLLLALSKAMPMLVADRVTICLYVIAFIFGFRYLATAIGPAGGRMALLASTVVLNWPLCMGFVNFCAGLAMACWGLGLWYRFRGEPGSRRRVYFLLLTFVMMFTHAVPLAMMLGVAALDLAISYFQRRRNHAPDERSVLFLDCATLFLSFLSFLYIKFFTTSHLLQQSTPVNRRPYINWYIGEFRGLIKEHGLAMFAGHYADATIERLFVFSVFLVGVILAGWLFMRRWRRNVWTHSQTWFCLSILSLFALPLVPHDINSSYYFSDRLLLPVWIAPLLAASGWCIRNKADQANTTERSLQRHLDTLSYRAGLALAILATAANISVLVAVERHIRPIAKEIKAAIDSSRRYNRQAGQMGMLLDVDYANIGSKGENWSPYMFAGAHIFRKNDVVLGNPPWVYLKIIPLAATEDLPVSHWSPWLQDHGEEMTMDLLGSPAFAKQALGPASVALIRQMATDSTPAIVQVLESGTGPTGKWNCTRNSSTWFWMCERDAENPAKR